MTGGTKQYWLLFVEKQRLFFQCISIQILCIFDVHCSLRVLNLREKNVKHLWSLEMSQRLTYLKGDVHRVHAVVLEVSSEPCVMWAVLQGLHVCRRPYYRKKNYSLGWSMAVYFCLLIFGIFFRKYIFVCSVLWLKKCYLCSQISDENVHSVTQLICLLALNSCGKK